MATNPVRRPGSIGPHATRSVGARHPPREDRLSSCHRPIALPVPPTPLYGKYTVTEIVRARPRFRYSFRQVRGAGVRHESNGPRPASRTAVVGSDPDDIPFDRLEPPYVLKSTHASGQTIIVLHPADLDVAKARARARDWLAYCHGTYVNEPAYIHLPRRLIVERLPRCPDGTAPLERRVLVYGGRAVFIRTTTSDEQGIHVSVICTTAIGGEPIAW